MKYLSICSGIEAASVAFEPIGWRPLAFSEIEAFPRAVLQHHYPDVPLHGDFTELKDEPWIVDADMLCGGTPCQAFSVAGNRQSLADDRGNLTLQFVLLADAIDHLRSTAGREPAWILWENVPGVLSTNDNAFGAFLGGLVGRTAPIPEPADGWTGAGVVDGPTRCAAWRILDAQHFGLAQRRKRVFVLARGGAGRWAVADALLPIIQSSRWHPAPSRGKGEGITPCLASGAENSNGSGIGREGDPMFTLDTTSAHAIAHTLSARPSGGGGLGTDFDLDGGLIPEMAGTMKANNGGGGWSNSADHAAGGYMVPVPPMAFVQNQREEVREQEVSGALSAEPGSHQTTYIAFDPAQVTSKDNRSKPAPGDPCHTLRRNEPPLLVRMREGKEGGGKGPLVSEDHSLTLATGNDQVLAYTIHGTDKTARVASETDLAGCIRTKAPGSIENSSTTVVTSLAMRTREGVVSAELGEPGIANALRGSDGGRAGEGAGAVLNGMQVRRLTPVECCRLQGFPDDYLDITYRGKPAADGNKYKALGNSWAVPVVRWIGKQINQVRNARLNG